MFETTGTLEPNCKIAHKTNFIVIHLKHDVCVCVGGGGGGGGVVGVSRKARVSFGKV